MIDRAVSERVAEDYRAALALAATRAEQGFLTRRPLAIENASR
jgi:hypothetical protein